jgi:hypothetical protein
MIYRPVIEEKLQEFKTKHPDYTFSQTIFAAIKQMECFPSFTKGDLLSISDEDFFTGLESALRVENQKSNKFYGN